MELICGACQGRLLVEAPGTTVACPHCGTHLQTPGNSAGVPFFPGPDDAPAAGPDPAEDTVRLNPWEVPGPASRAAPLPESFLNKPAAEATPGPKFEPPSSSSINLGAGQPEPVPLIRVSETGSIVVSTDAAPAAENVAPPPANSVAEMAVDGDSVRNVTSADDPAPATPEAAISAESAPPGEVVVPAESAPTSVAAGEPASSDERAADAAAEGPTQVEAPSVAAGRSANGRRAAVIVVSSVVLITLVSYASAITLLCLYLVMTRPSTLDLPDLAPPSKSKKVTTLIYLPPGKLLPPSNQMQLGETRQFGSVRVTPVRVTRGLVAFSYYKPEEDEARAPEGPVLKLHLRFDNVSRDQEFTPLDWPLVYTKEPNRKEYGLFKANNLVFNVADRDRPSKHVYIFDIPSSEWLLREQNLDHELPPGDSLETFIPTTAHDIEALSGDLVWRVHFRKGYNPTSFRGVTTLIEVLFKSSDIVDEEPAPAKPASKDA